jgi:twitching motility two-component system response regulator PilH
MAIKKILIVDDSPTDREFLSTLLAKNGFSVATAETAEDAMVKVKQAPPDLVLMDVVLPGQNGFQATRTLSRDDATKRIPVILCTSKGQETDRVWGLRQGARDYIVKPINQAELLAKIAALGTRVAEVPVDLDGSRRVGASKMAIGPTLAGYWRLFRAPKVAPEPEG